MAENKQITREEIRKIADLARIKLTEEEEQKFAREIGSILDHFKNISEAEAEVTDMVDHYELAENQLRKDEAMNKTEEDREKIRSQFPKRKENHLAVKAVL